MTCWSHVKGFFRSKEIFYETGLRKKSNLCLHEADEITIIWKITKSLRGYNMVFWTIVVFILGLVGLLHEIFLVNYSIPIFGEATSVCLLLVALGMFYTHHREAKSSKK